MHQFHNLDETAPPLRRHGPLTPTVRTYRQIAEILAEREGAPISPQHVQQMCRTAERKFARAVLADPVIREWSHPMRNANPLSNVN